ncbi:MAG: response regulator [Anaerolineae bacterium]
MDETDRQIVGLLHENGRRSNVEVARELGVSEGTVRKRVDRLLASGILKVVGVVDPRAAGYETRVLIFLKVDLAHLDRLTHQLKAFSEVVSVYCVTGEHDIVAEAAFSSDEALMAFLTGQLAGLGGVLSTTTRHVPSIVKHSFEWSLPQPPPPTVLVVDDDPDFVEITRTVLEAEDCKTLSASSGDAAMQVLGTQPVDLVILDIMMQGILDGWDAGRRIRIDPRLKGIPILVVSSITESGYLDMMPTDEDNLIDNFLSKPIEPSRLILEVKRLLRRRHG